MDCSICLAAITKQTGSTTLSCEHSFHFRCIDEWFTKQILDDLSQTCPCCRGGGTDMDRCNVEVVEENEEDEDDDYEEDDNASEVSQTDSFEDVSFADVMRGSARWQRVGEGQYMVILSHGMEAIAYESMRSMFGPLNELVVEETPEDIAAKKIQTTYRTYKNHREVRTAASNLIRLFYTAYNIAI